MMQGSNEVISMWRPIVMLDRTIDKPEDPTLHRAAIWWEVFSELPDDVVSRSWATYVADLWEHFVDRIEDLKETTSWVDRAADELQDAAIVAKAWNDRAIVEWRETGAGWFELERESARRLAAYVLASQQSATVALVEGGAVSRDAVRSRMTDAYVAGYLSGIAGSWCDSAGIDREERSGIEALLEVFRAMFGEERDEETASLFFERFDDSSEAGDGMVHAYEDVASFRRSARGVHAQPRMRLLAHLTAPR